MELSRTLPARTVGTLKLQTARQGVGILSAGAYLRVFAAASIVWFHVAPTGPFSEVGAVGLAIFVYLSCLHSGLQHGVRVPLARLGRQLLLPWGAWWLFYAALGFWRAQGVPPKLAEADTLWELLNWPAYHLWYLPTIFLLSAVLLGVRKLLAPLRSRVKAALAILGALGLLVIVAAGRDTMLPGILVYSMPAAALGLAYGYCLRLESRRHRTGAFAAIAALVAAMCVPIWLSGNHVVAIGYTGGSLLMILCTVPVPRQRLVMRLSALTLGVYLVHPFVEIVLLKFVGKSSIGLFAGATFLLSILATAGMRRIPYLRKLV